MIFGVLFISLPLTVAMLMATKYMYKIVEEVIEWIRFS